MAQDSIREVAVRRLIGARVRAARIAAGMSQTRVADAVRRRQGVISEWELGHRRISIAELWDVAGVLGVSVQDLAGPPRTAEERRHFEALVDEVRRFRALATDPG